MFVGDCGYLIRPPAVLSPSYPRWRHGSPVLLTGETGHSKELIARAIPRYLAVLASFRRARIVPESGVTDWVDGRS